MVQHITRKTQTHTYVSLLVVAVRAATCRSASSTPTFSLAASTSYHQDSTQHTHRRSDTLLSRMQHTCTEGVHIPAGRRASGLRNHACEQLAQRRRGAVRPAANMRIPQAISAYIRHHNPSIHHRHTPWGNVNAAQSQIIFLYAC